MRIELPNPPVECTAPELGKAKKGDYCFKDGCWFLLDHSPLWDQIHCTPLPPKVIIEIDHPIIKSGLWISIDHIDEKKGTMWVSTSEPYIGSRGDINIASARYCIEMQQYAIKGDNFKLPFIARVK